MHTILKNWKTTSTGIVTIAGGVTLYLHDQSKFAEALTAILAGIGLLFAHDAASTPTPGDNAAPPPLPKQKDVE